MKKILLFFISFFIAINVTYADKINSLDVDIYINDNGNAEVTENWNIDVSNNTNHTEIYKQFFNMKNSTISDLSVTMNDKKFTTLDDWDTSGSFSTKAYKAGINNVSEGYEICFGMSEYGNNKYNVKYTINNFVYSLKDSQLVYFAIIPENFSESIDKVYVKIHADKFFEDTLDVWGYGYEGYAYVYDGYIEMSTEKNLSSSDYMVVLIKFPEKYFNIDNSIDKEFKYYDDMAKKGSFKREKSFIEKIKEYFAIIMPIALNVLIWGGLILLFIKGDNKVGTKTMDYRNAPKKLPKDSDINYFRDIPCNKDVFKAYFIANCFKLTKKKTDFLGTLLLKWINEDKIETTTVLTKVLKKESMAVVFKDNLTFDNVNEERIYKMMKTAAGDNILEKDEFKKYCNDHYNKILDWFDDILDDEADKLVNEGLITKENSKYILSNELREDAIKLAGLKKFLNEFTNVKDKEAIQVKLLNEYLMFAQIFGIADKVAKEFKRLYPDVINDMTYDNIVFINYISTTGVSAASSAKSRAESYSSGGGGFSSSGGGGGSFGGGGGGGFR